MITPSRRDLRKLKTFSIYINRLEAIFNGLQNETKDFLNEEFTTQTALSIRQLQQNSSHSLELIRNNK